MKPTEIKFFFKWYLTCVLASLDVNLVLTGLDLKKLINWKATTGLGKSLNVRVCSAKFPKIFGELKKRT